jgi:hypothetical protein
VLSALLLYVKEYLIADPLVQLIILLVSAVLVTLGICLGVIIASRRRKDGKRWELPIDDPSKR